MTSHDGAARPSEFPSPGELEVDRVASGQHPTPVRARREPFVDDGDRVLLCSRVSDVEALLRSGKPLSGFEAAGPRPMLSYDPAELTCAVVTCGGICPGLNNVIRSIVLELTYAYGVRRILGFRYGYAGIAHPETHPPLVLVPDMVESLHEHGGTLLGSSRGPQDLGLMVDNLVRSDVGVLFVIGGDGGLRGASALAAEIARRRLGIAVVGVPKTIDNDLQWMWRTFGFDTAVDAARSVVLAAHAEARGAWNGVGLVKLMGRYSGFIAAHATLASADVNFCLVPEVPFALEGELGFLCALEQRLEEKHHAVVVVAEGAGQDLMNDGREPEFDASGNLKLKDVGTFLRDAIREYFQRRARDVTVRYIDPSYTIRGLPADSFDAQLCLVLGQYAVHAAMAGRTNMVVGLWNQRYVHVPIRLAVAKLKQLDPCGETWQRVLATTGQPVEMR